MNLILPFRSFTSHCCVVLLNSMLLARWISSRPSSCGNNRTCNLIEGCVAAE